jgi:hypothetical protein
MKVISSQCPTSHPLLPIIVARPFPVTILIARRVLDPVRRSALG